MINNFIEQLQDEVGYMCLILGIDVPKVIITDDTELFATDTTKASIDLKTRAVHVNKSLMTDAIETVFVVAHEVRHLWQLVNNKLDLETFKSSHTLDKSSLQDCEVDAQAFAMAYMHKYVGVDMPLDGLSDEVLSTISKHQESIDLTPSFRRMRKATGLTQESIGKLLNIPKRTIQDWEYAYRTPPQYVLELIEYKLRNEGLM